MSRGLILVMQLQKYLFTYKIYLNSSTLNTVISYSSKCIVVLIVGSYLWPLLDFALLINSISLICPGPQLTLWSRVGIRGDLRSNTKIQNQQSNISVHITPLPLSPTETNVTAKPSQVNDYYSVGKFRLSPMGIAYCYVV